MKKIISLVVLVSSIVFAQSYQTSSLVELKQNSLVNIQKCGSTTDLNDIQTVLRQESRRKSAPLAILYSFLLPGMGELYADSYDSGKYFTIAEGALWGVFTGFELYGKWKRDDYKSLAESKAGVSLDGKDDDYFANLGIYMSSEDYNNAMDLAGNYNKVYTAESAYWKWANKEDRKTYRDMWSSSENAFTNVRFVVGAMVLNRVISAINAVRLVSAYNKNLPVETSWNVSFGVDYHPTLPTSLTMNFVKEF